ncbi:beta-ketoacyl-ACP synthase II [Garciella nitratireducens]|uniref:3-oxoacyl-[acyl-carrier-protein] synthase 2 n=1 Tax=Garciella nitratireducens DSM 15102 TaxID=1121911 RepID=A0A1T4JY57_9FIRM|nr:beta-ketoacyl-ACP synthase II [Garciella nitratireducens]SJZ35093.1 3-oxoacyl-[acyl-carrier-protein] synthase II [Garciella nitratireducens DSM 15102]
MKKRVVITGIGVVSPIGIGKEKFWNAIKLGKCGIDTVSAFEIEEYPSKLAAEVKDFEVTDYITKKESRRMDRFSQFAMAASIMAMKDASMPLDDINHERMGVIIGTGCGGIATFEEQHRALLKKGPKKVSPFFIPMMICNMASGNVSIYFNAKGPNESVVTACASSAHALGEATRYIQRGEADIMIAGGTEAAVYPMAYAGFCSMKAMSTQEDPKKGSRPFDKNRDGFVMGEGAAILILEELEHALNRGANIIAEVVGYGATADAYHITAPAPKGEGAARAMKNAIQDAQIQSQQIEYINAHGTSTYYNDLYETQAIKDVFGVNAYQIPISSTKSMTGHLLGAAGAIEGAVCALALKEGFLPPTIHYENPDPECDLDYIPNIGREKDINYALSNSLGFGGHNACLIFKKY